MTRRKKENSNKSTIYAYRLNDLENIVLIKELKKQGYETVRDYLTAMLIKPTYDQAIAKMKR